jgi:hypothetical protein
MQPEPETQMIQPGKALKALDIFLSSMEEVAAGVAAASSKGPSTRPFRKDDARKEQRPPLTRSSSEDAGVVWALSHVETEDLSEDWSPVSVAGLTLTQSHSRDSGLDMYTVHDRCATLHHFKVPAKVLLTLPASLSLLYHDSSQYTHLGQQLTLHSLHRDVGDKYLHLQAAPLRHIQTAAAYSASRSPAVANVTRGHKHSTSLRGKLKECMTTLDEEAKGTRRGQRASKPSQCGHRQSETEKVPRNLTKTVTGTRHGDLQGIMTQSCSDPCQQIQTELMSAAFNQRYVVASDVGDMIMTQLALKNWVPTVLTIRIFQSLFAQTRTRWCIYSLRVLGLCCFVTVIVLVLTPCL